LRDAIVRASDNLEAGDARHPLSGEGRAFTDDRAPVETMTNALVLRYLLHGE
jgi:hypothetical protein